MSQVSSASLSLAVFGMNPDTQPFFSRFEHNSAASRVLPDPPTPVTTATARSSRPSPGCLLAQSVSFASLSRPVKGTIPVRALISCSGLRVAPGAGFRYPGSSTRARGGA